MSLSSAVVAKLMYCIGIMPRGGIYSKTKPEAEENPEEFSMGSGIALLWRLGLYFPVFTQLSWANTEKYCQVEQAILKSSKSILPSLVIDNGTICGKAEGVPW